MRIDTIMAPWSTEISSSAFADASDVNANGAGMDLGLRPAAWQSATRVIVVVSVTMWVGLAWLAATLI